MARRSFRLVLVLFGLLLTAGLGYLAIQDEQALGRARLESAALDRSAEEAVSALWDLRAALHAYVAPGQGLAFWAARSSSRLDTLRERLLALDAALRAPGASMAGALDSVDQLTAAERRARAYAGRGEPLLAGDVIFTEIRDLLTATGEQLSAVRNAVRHDSDRGLTGIRQQQAGLVVGAVALWVLIALFMLPGSSPLAVQNPKEWRHKLADALKKPRETADLALALTPIKTVEPVGLVEPHVAVASVKTVAEICSDLSTLTDVGALSGALERASDVIGAKGLIVWVASNDGGSLSPVATHGFDSRVVARIGTIARDSANLTGAAFRENTPKVSTATDSAAAALAVSMCGPSGPVGVLSAELRAGRSADDACVALATIFAAQLATLALPVTVPAAANTEAETLRAAR